LSYKIHFNPIEELTPEAPVKDETVALWLERSLANHTKDLKNGICCFSCFNAQHLRVAQRIQKQSVDYKSIKETLIHSRRYKTLAVTKRHKNHLSLSFRLLGF